MSQRLGCNYEYGFEREKASKMSEIESYVAILIENNKNYAEETNLLRKENTDLRGKIEVIMGEALKLKQNYEDSLAATKDSYSKEVGALIDELKDILHKKEQIEGYYKSLLEQLSYQSEFDKNNRVVQFSELERNYENKMKILNERIQEQNRELEANFYLNSDSKAKMAKEIDTLRFQIGELKKENNDLMQGHIFLEDQINRLSVSVKTISKEKEEMGVGLLKVEQDKNHSIIELRQALALLREQINDQVDNIKKLEGTLLLKEKEYQYLEERCQHEEREKCEYEDIYHKLSAQFSEKQAELSTLKIEFNKFSEMSNREIKRMGELIKVLETDNSRFARQKDELEHQNSDKQEEIYALLERVQRLEREYEATRNQLAKIQQESLDLGRNNGLLKEELEISLLQQKQASQKCMLQGNHMDTLQKLLEKQKKRASQLESSNNGRQIVYSKQMSYQNQINQRYQFELQSILKQKNELLSKFQSQRERLVRMYENALRQKQMLFKDKIHFLENQIMGLSQ